MMTYISTVYFSQKCWHFCTRMTIYISPVFYPKYFDFFQKPNPNPNPHFFFEVYHKNYAINYVVNLKFLKKSNFVRKKTLD